MSPKKITKNDLVDAVYEKSHCEKKTVQSIVDVLLSELKGALESGNTVELRGFGTFENRLRKGRTNARNPKTGEQLSIAPHYVSVFRPGQELKKSIWHLPIDEGKK